MYKLQLQQVESALALDEGNADLVQLKADLGQLIVLTQQNLLEEKKKELLREVEAAASQEGPADDVVEENDVDLSQLEGMRCLAPHTARGGSTVSTWHSAVIFHVENDVEDVLVRVVFSHPTSTDMVPCRFYMDGKCRFEESACKFSHGCVIRLADLREYREPNYDAVKENALVLAKSPQDCLWHHATVLHVGKDHVQIRFRSGHVNIERLPIGHVLPLDSADDRDDCESIDDDESLSGMTSASDSVAFAPVELLDRLHPVTSVLGGWEQHTRGIGSKLMAKMGYVAGAGLGKKQEGRVEPVPAHIYPQGKSLDWCMQLKERLGAERLSVERVLDRKKKQEEKKSQSQAGKSSLFDFINKKLGGKKTETSHERAGGSTSNRPQSNNLNVQSLQVSESIRKAEKEVQRLQAAHDRHKTTDPATARGIMAKIEEQKRYLGNLKAKESSISRAQSQKKENTKLTIF